MLTRREILAGLAAPAIAKRRPLNFVFFLIDDMGWRDCGAYGSRYEDGWLELFNLATDPGDTTNLVKREPQHSARMHQMLRRWRNSVDAAMPSPNPAYDPAQSDQGLIGAEPETPPA